MVLTVSEIQKSWKIRWEEKGSLWKQWHNKGKKYLVQEGALENDTQHSVTVQKKNKKQQHKNSKIS